MRKNSDYTFASIHHTKITCFNYKKEHEPKTITPELSESITQSKQKRFFNSIEKKKSAHNSVVVELNKIINQLKKIKP